MNRKFILAWAILLSLSLFIIFNYMPSIIELSALETENMLFLQLEGKVKELEIRFGEPEVKDAAVKATSIRSRRQLEKKIRTPRASDRKVSGQGVLPKSSTPLNPFNPY